MSCGARHYSWPLFLEGNDLGEKFRPGNRAARKHGAYRKGEWQPLAQQIAAELLEVAPWATRSTYAGTVAAWSRTEAQLVLVMDWLDEHGPLDGNGVPRPATSLLARLETQAANLRSELGLSPLALAKLTAAFSAAASLGDGDELEHLLAEGRRLRLAADTRLGLPTATRVGEGEGGGSPDEARLDSLARDEGKDDSAGGERSPLSTPEKSEVREQTFIPEAGDA